GEMEWDLRAEADAAAPGVAEAGRADDARIAIDDGADRAAVEAGDAELEGVVRRGLAVQQSGRDQSRGGVENSLHLFRNPLKRKIINPKGPAAEFARDGRPPARHRQVPLPL